MSRVEENGNIIKILGSYKMDRPWAALISILCDISQSLAVIADKGGCECECRNMDDDINNNAGDPGNN